MRATNAPGVLISRGHRQNGSGDIAFPGIHALDDKSQVGLDETGQPQRKQQLEVPVLPTWHGKRAIALQLVIKPVDGTLNRNVRVWPIPL